MLIYMVRGVIDGDNGENFYLMFDGYVTTKGLAHQKCVH